jgi:hypothetical protein
MRPGYDVKLHPHRVLALMTSCVDGPLSSQTKPNSSEDVKYATDKLEPYKSDGYSGCSSGHFMHAGTDLCIYLALLFLSMIVHGSVPDDFLRSMIFPIPTNILISLIAVIIVALLCVLYVVNFLIIWF